MLYSENIMNKRELICPWVIFPVPNTPPLNFLADPVGKEILLFVYQIIYFCLEFVYWVFICF